jgi:YD repeat-containing protein
MQGPHPRHRRGRGTGPDKNKQTDYTYNPNGKLATLTAQNSATGTQVTQFIYGTTSTSAIASNELLVQKIYPDDTGSHPDRITYTYDRLGEVTQMTDQNGTVHAYQYDKLGRLAEDMVTTLGSTVDDLVLRIGRTYEVHGLPLNITSYNNATVGSGSVVNDIQFVYDPYQQLSVEYQSHSGAVNTTSTPRVGYQYDYTGSVVTARPSQLTYPTATRTLAYEYGTSGSLSVSGPPSATGGAASDGSYQEEYDGYDTWSDYSED